MEFLIEILFEVCVEAMFAVLPSKRHSKAVRAIACILALLALIGVIALFIWGTVLLKYGNRWGYLPIAASVLLGFAWFRAGMNIREDK